jgi:RHS repeat-associated protein
VSRLTNGTVTATFTQKYDYDSLNRLQRVYDGDPSTPVWQQRYGYDRYGNRTIDQANTSPGLNSTQFDANEAQYTNRLYAPGDTSLPMNQRQMRYDAAGNLNYDNYTGQGTRSYDAENRMTQAWANNQWQTYTYDGEGHRVKRLVGTTETWQVYGLGGELLAEYAANANHASPQKEYGYRNGQLLVTATVTSGGWGAPPAFDDNPLNPHYSGETTVRAAHIIQLRTGIDALRGHLGYAPYAWQYSATTNDWISANPIIEMRTALDQALGAPSGGYSPGLAQYQPVMAIHIQELRNRVLGAWNSSTGGTDIRWLVADQLGTPRMIFDQSGSLTVTDQSGNYVSGMTRHDYLPFGEELYAGVGGRTAQEGYNTDNVRQHFTGYEADGETGLNFAQARYQAPVQGRFTSPDPLMASANARRPQTWNRYSYVLNNPLRLIDPSGMSIGPLRQVHKGGESFITADGDTEEKMLFPDTVSNASDAENEETAKDEIDTDLDAGKAAATEPQNTEQTKQPDTAACDKKLAGLFGGDGAVADTGRTPSTLQHSTAGMQRFPDHSAEGGVMHLYTNAQGTPASVGLYVPTGFSAVPGGRGTEYYPNKPGQVNAGQVNYNYAQYRNSAGVTISFVHIGAPVGPQTNAMGSTLVGSIAGPGGDAENGYNHTHINFYSNFATRTRVDPRKLFCKEFGF